MPLQLDKSTRLGFLKNRFAAILDRQRGFTLIEMIVVVGIIAVLSGAIAPNVIRWTSVGKQSAKDAERDHVEDAFELMLTENHIVSVTPHDNSNGSNANALWTALPLGGLGVQALEGYLINASTVYYYCYDSSGYVSEQFEAPASCTIP